MQPPKYQCRSGIRYTLISILLILIILSSGCIHIDLGNPFQKPKPETKEYQIVTKEGFPIKHAFNLEEDTNYRHSETQPFYAPKGTEWFNVSIMVEINGYGIINNSPINISFLEQYVRVKIKGPDDETYYQNEFRESSEQLRAVDYPETGRWLVEVEAQGFGNSEVQDQYEINVVAYEPK